MFTSLCISVLSLRVWLPGLVSAHCDPESPSVSGGRSRSLINGAGAETWAWACRGDNHVMMIYCGYHCSVHLRQCPPKKKLLSATAMYIRDLYLCTLLKAEAGSGKKQEKIKSSKIQAFLNKQEDFNSLLFYSLNVNRIWALMKT